MSLSVEYVLTAEFDIDAGPTVTYQFPQPIVCDKQTMAELMLPDQSHARTQDWTVFFLYKKESHDGEEDKFYYNLPDEADKQTAKQYFVLNLVNTKFDSAVKRGAVVKSMCIVTQCSFFQTFKPLLILALDDYFKSGEYTCLRDLYDSLNTLDLAKLPVLTRDEKLLLACSENTQLFSEKFQTMRDNDTIIDDRMKYLDIKTDPESNNNSATHHHTSITSGPMSSLSGANLIRDCHFYDTTVQFKNLKIPVKIPTDQIEDTVGDFSMGKLVSLLINSNQTFAQSYHPHLTIYGANTPPILVLIYALLTQKRILFVGLNTPSQEVSEMVLAACSLGSGGILRSLAKHAFPYTDLSKVDDLLATPGYIAGVKNPTFEHHPSWWDIIIDLETQKIKISKDISEPAPANVESDYNLEDVQLIDDLKRMLTNHYGDISVRSRCWQYIKRIVRMTAVYEDYKFGATNLWPSMNDHNYVVSPLHGYVWTSDQARQQDFVLYGAVLEGWRESRSYKYFIEDQRDLAWNKPPKTVVDYDHLLDKLKYFTLDNEESELIYDLLCSNTKDHDDVIKLLLAISANLEVQTNPSSSNTIILGATSSNITNSGGSTGPGADPMFILSLGLFHRDHAIRLKTSRLLHIIETDTVGKMYFGAMNHFEKLTYQRLLKEANKGPFIPENGVPF